MTARPGLGQRCEVADPTTESAITPPRVDLDPADQAQVGDDLIIGQLAAAGPPALAEAVGQPQQVAASASTGRW